MIASLAAASLLAASVLVAQEGFPLDGTWRGEWGSGDRRTPVVIVVKWDGKDIGGVINPGRSSAPFTAAELDPADWSVHLEADLPNTSGSAMRVVIEGTLEDIGSYNRTITGTWSQDGVANPLKLRRE